MYENGFRYLFSVNCYSIGFEHNVPFNGGFLCFLVFSYVYRLSSKFKNVRICLSLIIESISTKERIPKYHFAKDMNEKLWQKKFSCIKMWAHIRSDENMYEKIWNRHKQMTRRRRRRRIEWLVSIFSMKTDWYSRSIQWGIFIDDSCVASRLVEKWATVCRLGEQMQRIDKVQTHKRDIQWVMEKEKENIAQSMATSGSSNSAIWWFPF